MNLDELRALVEKWRNPDFPLEGYPNRFDCAKQLETVLAQQTAASPAPPSEQNPKRRGRARNEPNNTCINVVVLPVRIQPKLTD